MSEPSGERQFEASAARLRKAREEGDVPRSADLCGALAFAAATLAIAAGMPWVVTSAEASIREAALQRRLDFALLICLLASAMLLPLASGACGAIAAGVLQTGGLQLRMPRLSFTRLNPSDGCKRIFSRDTFLTMLRGAIALSGILAVLVLTSIRVVVQAAGSSEPAALGGATWNGALCVAIAGAAFAVLFGAVDFITMVRRWRGRLRMTLAEFKRDQKETEGDPLLRSRRRSAQRQSSRLAVQRVADAAFVVVNPTHIAIALEYRPPDVAVPRVLIRAAGEAAMRVRAEAVAQQIPIVEDTALARALYTTTEVGQPVPLELYIAVAAIVVALSRASAISK